jgi:AbrB family looped-hinge helix DNA binding protein
MKIGTIVQTNQKGQIVIPKRIRKLLGVTPDVSLNLIVRGKGLYIQPIEEVITKAETETSYLDLLKKTQGAWEDENWGNLREKRKQIETTASEKRKSQW